MIKLINSEGEWEIITPTIFPDGTSQVWKLKQKLHNKFNYIIKWNFENEAECIYVDQLVDLLRSHNIQDINLDVPYFPYARQDKKVSNDNTFARHTFIKFLERLYCVVNTYDIHSDAGYCFSFGSILQNNKPTHILSAIEESSPNFIFFPDKGALTRYSRTFENDLNKFSILPKIYGEKVRDQSSGQITSYEISVLPQFIPSLSDARILIIDDICDRGGTFVLAAEHLKKLGVGHIELCVSHGIFSGGQQLIHDAGINHIYTTNSLIHNVSNKNKTVYEV